MKELLFRGHLGLGDHLVTNAIVRERAEHYEQVVVLCKEHNAPSVAFMFRDLVHVYVFSVSGDDEADELCDFAEKHGKDVLRLGFYGQKPFDIQKWDSEFFRQAKVPFQERWNSFKVSRQPSREIKRPASEYIWLHDDPSRKMVVDRSRLPKGKLIIQPGNAADNIIFDYWEILENAAEIHCIDSCFAIFVDSLPVRKAKRLCLHEYAKESIPPTYQNQWERLK